VLQNTNSGNVASTNFIVSNNLGTSSTYFGELGMNSSTFAGSGAFNAPNTVYLDATSADLAIGTTTNNAIHFVVNNGATDAMTIGTSGAITAGVWNGSTIGVGYGGTGTSTAFTTGSVVFAGASGVYSQNNAKFFWDNTNNRLGINTATPQTQLTVVSNTQTTTPTGSLPAGTDLYIVGANAANTRITQDAYGTGAYGAYTARSARGTAASPTASQSGDFLAQFTARGYGATGFGTASTGYIAFSAAENFTDTAQGTYAGIYTTPTGSNSIAEAFRFGPAGQLGIGGATYGTSGQFLTSGGASAAPSWTTVTLATLGGVVPVSSGGTNITSYTVGDLLYASASTTLSKLADVATGSVLVSGGVGVAPAWSNSPTVTALTTGSISISGNETHTGTGARILGDFTNATITNRLAFQTSTTNSTTGIYALPNGTSTAASWQATNAADPTNASKILIATNGSTDVQLVSGINGTGTYLPLSFYTNGSGQFAINTSGAWGIGSVAGATVNYGTSGQVFTSGGSSVQPSWSNVSGLAVTSINFGTTGLTPSTATQGAVTVAGTLVAANGGTGQSSYTVGDLLYASTTTALSKLAAVATGSVLVSSGTGTAPAYSASPTLTTSLTTPLLIGGTTASSTLTLESTSGAGTSDSIIFKTGSQSTAMTIDTSQNVGIGTTSPGYKLDVSGAIRTTSNLQIAGSDSSIIRNGGNTWLYISSGTGYGTAGAAIKLDNSSGNGTTIFYQGTNESARIDSSGNVGIGTTSPSTYTNSKLASYAATGDVWNSTDAAAATAGSGFHFYNNGTLRGEINTGGSSFSAWGGANSFNILGFANAPMTFATNSAERMRIDSSGNLLVGTTSTTSVNAGIAIIPNGSSGTTGYVRIGHSSATSGQGYLDFLYNNSIIGSVQQAGTTGVSFNTSSDYRLKENVTPITTGLAKISALKPVTYDWISDKSAGEGFIAHELQAIIPNAVTGEKDAVDEGGKPIHQGVDYSKIVVHLVAAIQEQQVTITALTARIAALEAK